MNVDLLLILVVLTNLRVLGSSRLGACIRTTAVQGVLLGLLPLLAHTPHLTIHTVLLAAGSMALKGVVFPWLLFRAIREADVQREIEPYIGYNLSLLLGMAAIAAAVWLSQRLPLPAAAPSPWIVPTSLFSILAGLVLIIGRKKAISQVLGFLVMENGIYTFGVGLVHETSFLVELGVLLDVFVGVFVMGITLFHISREFDHIDADQLNLLEDWKR